MQAQRARYNRRAHEFGRGGASAAAARQPTAGWPAGQLADSQLAGGASGRQLAASWPAAGQRRRSGGGGDVGYVQADFTWPDRTTHRVDEANPAQLR